MNSLWLCLSPLVVSSSAFPLLDILIKLLLQRREPEFSLEFDTFSLVQFLSSLLVS